MGSDRMRVLVCAVASIALIVAGALVMDWYRMSFDAGVGFTTRIAVDLRHVHVCQLGPACLSAPLTSLSGMFPALAAVTVWSSLAVAALVVFQAGVGILSGSANDSLTRLGYMFSLMAISIAVATAYMFGPEHRIPMSGIAAEIGVTLHRTWGPLTLIGGLVAGVATLYISVVPVSSDRDAAYKQVTLAPARALTEMRTRTPSVRIPFPEHTGLFPILARDAVGLLPPDEHAAGTAPIPIGPGPGAAPLPDPAALGLHLARERPTTDLRPPRDRPPTGGPPIRERAATGPLPARTRTATGVHPVYERTATGLMAPGRSVADPRGPGPQSAPVSRTKSGPILPIPDHLRNRLAYVAITAELTGGGIDARREDGSSRLVLWRDVVGVVARRMPPAYDGTTFIDVVSTAGSTLRIVPWTRLTGEPIDGEGDARPRGVVERVVARCPAAKLDPATRQFLETGEPAQLPDLETLRAHDLRLA